MPRKKATPAQRRARALFTKRYGKKKAGGSRVAGSIRSGARSIRTKNRGTALYKVASTLVRKKASGSSVAGKMRRARPWKIRKTKRPVKKASGSSVAGRTRRVVRRRPRKKASGSSVAGRTRRTKKAGGKWKDRILWLPNQAVKQTFGRLAKSIWKRNR